MGKIYWSNSERNSGTNLHRNFRGKKRSSGRDSRKNLRTTSIETPEGILEELRRKLSKELQKEFLQKLQKGLLKESQKNNGSNFWRNFERAPDDFFLIIFMEEYQVKLRKEILKDISGELWHKFQKILLQNSHRMSGKCNPRRRFDGTLKRIPGSTPKGNSKLSFLGLSFRKEKEEELRLKSEDHRKG